VTEYAAVSRFERSVRSSHHTERKGKTSKQLVRSVWGQGGERWDVNRFDIAVCMQSNAYVANNA
jgi:hypothetical protein